MFAVANLTWCYWTVLTVISLLQLDVLHFKCLWFYVRLTRVKWDSVLTQEAFIQFFVTLNFVIDDLNCIDVTYSLHVCKILRCLYVGNMLWFDLFIFSATSTSSAMPVPNSHLCFSSSLVFKLLNVAINVFFFRISVSIAVYFCMGMAAIGGDSWVANVPTAQDLTKGSGWQSAVANGRYCHVMYKLLYPSIRVRTAPPVSVRVRTRVSFGLRILFCMCGSLQ